MTAQAVSLKVVAPVAIDCNFWIEDDGWTGVCQSLSVGIHAASFEEAKKKMESTLRERIEALLQKHIEKSEPADVAQKIA